MIFQVLGTAVATVVYSSLLEWFVHGIAFHRWFARIHAAHHAEYRGVKYQQPGPYRNLQRWWLEPVAVAIHVPLFLLIGAWLGVASGITALLVLALYAAASNFLHTAIHCPHGRLVERTAWYRRLVARHHEHHLDARVNFTIPTQIGDMLMGSFREAAATPDRMATRAPSSGRRS
jgi:hypothetical protein